MVPSQPVSSSHTSDLLQLDLREMLFVLRRRVRLIASAAFSFFLLVALVAFIKTPLYEAETTLQINTRQAQVVNMEAVMAGISANEPAIQSELDIIRSTRLVGNVVDALGLMRDKEFNPDFTDGEGIGVRIMHWIRGTTGEEQDAEAERIARVQTIGRVQDYLKVERKPLSLTIAIRFRSVSPEKAARITNAFADEYLKYQLQTKFDATERANGWLRVKLEELKQKVNSSEVAVQAYQEKHGLIESGGKTVSDQQLGELNTQLVLARTERAQAEARLRAARDGKGASDATVDVLSSQLIQRLREQETEVLRKRSELSSRYGPRHPKIVLVNAELRDLKQKIGQEIGKVTGGLENAVQVAIVREKSLQANLDQLQGKVGGTSLARVELNELVRERDANRHLYESFLNRFKETSQQQGLNEADARVISTAEIPLEPSYPKKKVMLLVGFLLGVVLGVALAFVMEHLDNAFRGSEQLERELAVPSIGMVPEITNLTNLVEYVVNKPTSVFAESLRSVFTNIHLSNPDHPAKVIMVTSTVPKEGKSSFSLAMATLLAKSGKKVLLVDCDLRRPSIARVLGVDVKHGISDLLVGDVTEKEAIRVDARSGLHFIGSHANVPNSQDIVSSNRMKEFLTAMSKKYDVILLDTPPVMAVSDALSLAHLADAVAFVVRWDKTPRPLVKTAVKQLQASHVKLSGVVMSRVDLERHARYGYGDRGYYYGRYQEYYTA